MIVQPPDRRKIPDAAIISVTQAAFPDSCGGAAVLAELTREPRRQLRIYEEANLAGDDHRMINILCCVGNACANVFGLEVRKIPEYLLARRIACEDVEHIFDADPHPTDAWTPPALIGINCDAL
jgi:hypothetical protein